MTYNVKEYGVVSTDGSTGISVGAPMRDDYYPTMYEVKKLIEESSSNDSTSGSTGD